MLEVLGKDQLGKQIHIFDHKAPSVLRPADNLGKVLSLSQATATSSIWCVLRIKAGIFFAFYII